MIRDIFDKLEGEDRARLLLAFENEDTHFVTLKNNKFIGVNVERLKKLKSTTQEGSWFYGDIL